jgi:RNA polymerase sigma factor (sigma-70 family)
MTMSQKSCHQPETHASLLREVSDPGNHRAWEEFIDRYNPMIRGWCRHWFPNSADDMAHEVMVKLVFVMRSYTYQPDKGRFRGWLKTVTNHMMAELKRSSNRVVVDSEALEGAEAPIDLEIRLAAEYDLELREIAEEKVRGRVEPRTWSAYFETAVQLRSPAEVAKELGMRVGAVYQAKCCVLRALREEVKVFEGSC